LCFGGIGADYTYWAPSFWDRVKGIILFRNPRGVISPPDLDRMFGFARAAGWRVILTLNLRAGIPEMGAEEAAYAATAGGGSVMAFQFGNEPDLYARNRTRDSGYNYDRYLEEFEVHRRALLDRLPGAVLAGPGTASTVAWVDSFVEDNAGKIALATNHYYPLNAGAADPADVRYAGIENMLSASMTKRTTDSMKRFARVPQSLGIPFRISETNSAYPGPGKEGVTDVFASSLWAADYLFSLAEAGLTGADFHGIFSPDYYSPITLEGDRYVAQPLYYGLLLFSHAAQGRLVPLDLKVSANVTAHATLAPDGRLLLTIINKEAGRPAIVQITADSRYTQASALRLVAPSLTARKGITFGGNPVAVDGTWSAGEVEVVQRDNAGFRIEVPAGSAAVVTFK